MTTRNIKKKKNGKAGSVDNFRGRRGVMVAVAAAADRVKSID